jgi:hypothetical protein
VLRGQSQGHGTRVDEAELDQHLPERRAAALLFCESGYKLLLVQEAVLDKHPPQGRRPRRWNAGNGGRPRLLRADTLLLREGVFRLACHLVRHEPTIGTVERRRLPKTGDSAANQPDTEAAKSTPFEGWRKLGVCEQCE